MRKRTAVNRTFTKTTYIALSVGIASLIIFTALPYYLLSSIGYPRLNIFWGYEYVQQKMMWLFPGLALAGAITTLKKRNTVEDVFLNVAFPLIILLVLKVVQYHPAFTIGAVTVAVIFSITSIVDINADMWTGKMEKSKRMRLGYYAARKCIVYILLFTLAPMAVWVGYHEDRDRDSYLTYYSLWANSDDEINEEENQLDIVSSRTWDNLSVESRFSEVSKLTTFFLQDLGVEGVNIYAVKELTDGTLAYYSDEEQTISFNAIYLAECSLEEAVHVTAHECYHRYEHEVIRSVETLQEAGFDCENMDVFEEAVALKKADDDYYLDSLSYDTYSENLLEKGSEEYAGNRVEKLKKQGYLD